MCGKCKACKGSSNKSQRNRHLVKELGKCEKKLAQVKAEILKEERMDFIAGLEGGLKPPAVGMVNLLFELSDLLEWFDRSGMTWKEYDEVSSGFTKVMDRLARLRSHEDDDMFVEATYNVISKLYRALTRE